MKDDDQSSDSEESDEEAHADRGVDALASSHRYDIPEGQEIPVISELAKEKK